MPLWSLLGLFGASLVTVLGCATAHAAPRARTTNDLWVADRDLDGEPRAVDGASAARDLDVAVRAFDQAYAGLDGHAPTPPAARIAATRARLSSQTRWSPLELTNELRELLRQPDGHLSFGWGGASPMHVAAWPRASAFLSSMSVTREGSHYLVDGRPLVTCDTAGRFEDAIFRAVSGDYRLAVFEPHAGRGLRCEVMGGNGAPERVMLPMREIGLPSALTGPAVAWEQDGRHDKVPVLRIRTLDSAEAESLEQLPAYAETLRRAPAFVVDLRGNSGGNYTFAERFITALTDRTLQRLDEREVVSIAAAEGRANGARARLARGEVPPSAMALFQEHLDRLDAVAKNLRDHDRPARQDLVTRASVVHGSASGPMRGRGVFLVDGGCASACEMMLSLARQIPGVVVAGQSTRGSMAVGELALFRLPRSGVTITLGTRAFHDPRFDFAETRGYLPDYWIDSGDALGDAVRLAAGPRRDDNVARR